MANVTSVLSSDILERQFGPTTIEVLYQDTALRIICTKVMGTGQVLELSRVKFIQAGIEAFPSIHEAVVKGRSMGKAFKEFGVSFERETSFVARVNLPVSFSHYYEAPGLSTIVGVAIFVGDEHAPYAHILETYSPEVKWPATVGVPTEEQLARLAIFDTSLRKLGQQ